MNLSSLIKRIANKYPEKTAIIEEAAHSPFFNKEEKGEFSKQISYKQLWQRIESLSKAFRTIGIRKNNRVAIILPNCKEFIFSFFALLNLNAIAVPLKPQMTCWELAGIFKNCKPKVIILTPNLLNKIVTENPSLLRKKIIIIKQGKTEVRIFDKGGYLKKLTLYTLNDLYKMDVGSSRKKSRIHTHPRQIASINYTYRGYGYPLGAMLTHNNYIHGAIRYIKLVQIQPDMRILLLLPISHIFPLTGCVLVPLLAKGTIVIATGIKAKGIFQTIEKNKVNVLVCVPTLYTFLLKYYDNTKWDTSSLQYGISGAELMSVDLHDKIKVKMGIDIIQGYGLTETLPVTCNPRWGNRPETIGIIAHDVKLKVVDERGKECNPGEVGEIIVNCPSVMACYYKAPKETSDVIKGGWFYTGDYGMVDYKKYVHFKGLKKPIAKINGITVDLNEIKNILNKYDKIHTHDIVYEEIKKKLNQKGNKGIIYKHAVDNNNTFLAKKITKFLSRYLSQYKLPKKLIKI